MTRSEGHQLAARIAFGVLLAVPIEGQAQRPHPAALQDGRQREALLIRAVPTLTPQPADRWFGADKIRHLGASAAIQIMGFGVLRSARVRPDPALVAAGVTTFAAGVGKELYDRRHGGSPSVRDLVWDIAGIAIGSVVAVAADVR